MQTITYDTHESVKSLKSAGFSDAQEEAVVAEMKQSHSDFVHDLATKQDLKELKQNLKELEASISRDIRELELRTDAKFETVHGELRLLKWMLGLMLGGVLSLVLKAFFIP